MYDHPRKPDPEVMARLDRIEWVLKLLCGHQGMSRDFLDDEWTNHQKVQERSKKALLAERDR